MKNNILINTIAIPIALSIFFMASILFANENTLEPNNKYLSVRDSLLPMLNSDFRSNNKYFPINRINPDIKQYVLYYLENDNSSSTYASNGIWLLGIVGTKNDMNFVDNYIQSRLNSSNEDDKRFILQNSVTSSIGCFTGMMLKRDISEAKQFFNKYANLSAWIYQGATDDERARRACNCFVYASYQYSKADFILSFMKQNSSGSKPLFSNSDIKPLEERKTARYTEIMEPSKTSEEILDKYRKDFLNEGGATAVDRLLKKQTLAEWRKEQEEKKTVTNTRTKPDESFEIVDMNETVEGANIKAIVLDAVKAYIGIPVNKVEENILIDTKILKEIKAAGFKNFNEFKVKAEIEASINNFVPIIISGRENNEATTSEPNVIFNRVKANITFDILGSADILKKYGPDAAHVSLLSPKTGDLTANMIRINDGWLWAPFSDSPINTDSNIVSDKYLIDCANKAVIAYNQISQSIIDGNYDPLTIPVLDNGKLIPLNKREKDKDGMAKALDLEKKILEDLAKAKLNNYNDYQMKVTIDATVDNGILNLETGTMPKDVKGYETIDLTFMIPNGAEVYKKNISERMDQSSIDGKGNLKVSMKKINGTWYWNPFGW